MTKAPSSSEDFAQVDGIIAAGVESLVSNDFTSALGAFEQAIALLANGESRTYDAADRLAECYDLACRAAYRQAALPDLPDSADFQTKGLLYQEQSFMVREAALRMLDTIPAEARGALIAQADALTSELVGCKQFELALGFGIRCIALQVEFQDTGVMPQFFFSAKGNIAIALFQLKRYDEALNVINEALSAFPPHSLNEAQNLQSVARLCSMKITVLGAINRKKLH